MPSFVSEPVPLTTPVKVVEFDRLNVIEPELATVVAAIHPVVPPLPTDTVPAEIVKVPVKVLLPVRVSVPEPALVKPPVSEITPENVVDDVSPPAVNVPEPSVIEPAPAMEPTVSVMSFRSNVASESTVTAVVSAKRPEPDSMTTPAEICVTPV